MNKSLNTSVIQERLTSLGLSQSKVSLELSVSREAVSQWLSNESFPRPGKLLKLGSLLSLKYSELVTQSDVLEPFVAFRKVGNAITKTKHIQRAKEMGGAFEQLVPFLPFENLTNPTSLNQPVLEYSYIQSAASAIRNLLGISKIKIEVSDIISYFSQSKTILVPVLLGGKKNHENAIHIHLPKSATNWIYINLDTNELDFKFWLVHELGHILSPQLRDDDISEEFADNFAGAFLFPEEIAASVHKTVSQLSLINQQLSVIFANATRYTISAITVLKEINKYAKHHNLQEFDFGRNFYPQNTQFNKKFALVSRNIFGSNKPSVEDYITLCAREFQTVFFDSLSEYISQKQVSSSFIITLLNLPVTDSIEIYNYLNGL